MDSLDEPGVWLSSMRERTCRSFAQSGSTPAGWHVLLPDGEFGFLDIDLPASAEHHAQLIQRARNYMRTMSVRACMFVAERELADGRPVLLFQHEVIDARGRRDRGVQLLRIAANASQRIVDTRAAVHIETDRDRELARSGMFPDLLPDPPSPLRIL